MMRCARNWIGWEAGEIQWRGLMSDAHGVAHPAVRALWFNFQQGGLVVPSCVRPMHPLSSIARRSCSTIYVLGSEVNSLWYFNFSSFEVVCTYVVSVPFSRYATKAATTFYSSSCMMHAWMHAWFCACAAFLIYEGGPANGAQHDFIHILHRKKGFR